VTPIHYLNLNAPRSLSTAVRMVCTLAPLPANTILGSIVAERGWTVH
jgi:hypothetical protein